MKKVQWTFNSQRNASGISTQRTKIPYVQRCRKETVSRQDNSSKFHNFEKPPKIIPPILHTISLTPTILPKPYQKPTHFIPIPYPFHTHSLPNNYSIDTPFPSRKSYYPSGMKYSTSQRKYSTCQRGYNLHRLNTSTSSVGNNNICGRKHLHQREGYAPNTCERQQHDTSPEELPQGELSRLPEAVPGMRLPALTPCALHDGERGYEHFVAATGMVQVDLDEVASEDALDKMSGVGYAAR